MTPPIDPIPAASGLGRELTRLAKQGPPELLAARLADDPWIARARVDDGTCVRSMLHLATDWPGHRKHAAAVIRLLVEAGCDPNARAEGPTARPRCTGRRAATTSRRCEPSSSAGRTSRWTVP